MSTTKPEQHRRLFELLETREPLDPELEAFLGTSGGVPAIGHPLVHETHYHPTLNALCNHRLREKHAAVSKARAKRRWEDYIFLHERPYRLDAFDDIAEHLSDAAYWRLLSHLWCDSENIWQHGEAWDRLLRSDRARRSQVMTGEEQRFLRSLPPLITVYRGHMGRNRHGWSWTLSYWRAHWFSRRFGHRRSGVLKGEARREDLIAVLLRRNESEVIIDPRNVLLPTPFTVAVPRRLRTIFGLASERFTLGSGSLHGPVHWAKVLLNASEIAKRTPGADARVCELFAILHDCERQNEDADPSHGKRAARYTKELQRRGDLMISGIQLRTLVSAIAHHEDGDKSDDPTIGACWDADRLDLSRVGIMARAKFLSTRAAIELLWRL